MCIEHGTTFLNILSSINRHLLTQHPHIKNLTNTQEGTNSYRHQFTKFSLDYTKGQYTIKVDQLTNVSLTHMYRWIPNHYGEHQLTQMETYLPDGHQRHPQMDTNTTHRWTPTPHAGGHEHIQMNTN